MATRPKLPDIGPASTQAAKVHPNHYSPPGPIGNTQGKIVPDTEAHPGGNSAPPIKPTEKEKSWWQRWGSDVVHTGLDIVGLIPGVGEVADGANALIYLAEGDKVNAAISAAAMVPGAGMAATGAKLGKKAVGAAAEGAAKKAGREATEAAAKKAEKEAAEKAEKELAERKAKSNDGGKDKKTKKKMKCGDFGKYGDLKKKTGEGQFDRDHVPSKSALKQRAKELASQRGEKLTSDQAKAIENLADAISIPKSTHKKSSRTYGGRNTSERVNSDAADLNAALENDLDEILKDLEKTDPECAKKYKKIAEKLKQRSINNKNHFDDFLTQILDDI